MIVPSIRRQWVKNRTSRWYCHEMETLSTCLTLCWGNPSVTSGFPLKGQWWQPALTAEQTVERQANKDFLVVIWRHYNLPSALFRKVYATVAYHINFPFATPVKNYNSALLALCLRDVQLMIEDIVNTCATPHHTEHLYRGIVCY